MQVIILCGGSGSRMYPETEYIPKPMITIGDKPILWHIMKYFSDHGHKDFLLLVGFRSDMIRSYFKNPRNIEEGWNIEYSDAGIDSRKGDRLRKALNDGAIKGDKMILGYGDDLCNVDINEVIKAHGENSKTVTITSVPLMSNFGIIKINPDGHTVDEFQEKPKLDHWINGGYIIMNREVLDHMAEHGGDETDTFGTLTKEGKVQIFKHNGFWKSMNTIKDMENLRDMWSSGELQKIMKREL